MGYAALVMMTAKPRAWIWPDVVLQLAVGVEAGLVVAVAEVSEPGGGVGEQVPDDDQDGAGDLGLGLAAAAEDLAAGVNQAAPSRRPQGTALIWITLIPIHVRLHLTATYAHCRNTKMLSIISAPCGNSVVFKPGN